MFVQTLFDDSLSRATVIYKNGAIIFLSLRQLISQFIILQDHVYSMSAGNINPCSRSYHEIHQLRCSQTRYCIRTRMSQTIPTF